MAKIPTSIQVGPFTYSVEVTEAAIDKASRAEKCDLLGFSDHRSQQILLRPGMGADCEVEILLHEVLHAVTSMTGVKAEMDEDSEEKVVNRMAPALLDLLRRNSDLVAYLVG